MPCFVWNLPEADFWHGQEQNIDMIRRMFEMLSFETLLICNRNAGSVNAGYPIQILHAQKCDVVGIKDTDLVCM